MNITMHERLSGMRLCGAYVFALICVLTTGPAFAAVALLDGWRNTISTTNNSPQSFNYTMSAGTNRVFVVAITTKYGSTGTRNYSASYGSRPLAMIAQYNTGRENTWLGYLKEADLAARTNDTVQVTFSGRPSNTKVFAASYQNVDQSSPITDANANGSSGSVNTISFGRAVAIASGDQLVYVAHSGSSTATHTPPSGYTELLEHGGNGFSASIGHRIATTTGSENQTVRFSASSRASLAVAALNEASAQTCTSAAATVNIAPASRTITTNTGNAQYTVTVRNNDSGAACGTTALAFAVTDSDATGARFMVPSMLSTSMLSLASGQTATLTLTVRAAANATTGTNVTLVRATASDHPAAQSNTVTTTIAGAPATGPESAGWYAGDMHVHRSCGGTPESVSSVTTKMDTNNLAALSLLADMGNGEVLDPRTDLPLVTGSDAPESASNRIVHWDAEWHWDATYPQFTHQALGGHVVALGLSKAEQVWEEYTYPIFEWAHQQNAIAGFVHMQYLGDTIPQSLTCCTPIEYPVEVALGSADFIAEDIGGSDYAVRAYYRLLNTGFRPGFAAGTDYPCNSGANPGSLLTYVKVSGGAMTYRNWIDGIAQGRTVVSRNGHNEFLDLTVNSSSGPGDEIRLGSAGSLPVTITWTANENLTGTIELVKNGSIVASKQASSGPGSPATLTANVDFANSGWLATRRMDSSTGHMVHTGAVFVMVNNAPIRASVADAEFYVAWMDNLLTKTATGGVWNSYFPTSLSRAQARYQAAKAVYQQIAREAGGRSTTLGISTSSLPAGVLNTAYTAQLEGSGGTAPYTWSFSSGSLPAGLSLNAGAGSIMGTPSAAGTYDLIVQVVDSSNPVQTTTKAFSLFIDTNGAILLISSTTNPFSRYYAEILRAEGMNAFTENDITSLTAAVLASYDVAVLGQMTLTAGQAAMFSDWVAAGGHLIAMRPDKKLSSLLGLIDLSSTISDAYLLVNTSSGPGAGIVDQTIQYHGTADRYGLNGAASIATLYSSATTSTNSPAVTLRSVGSNNGQAAAFTYDLARSVVYTRQGNPAWAGQERDNDLYNVIRSDDLFYGAARYDFQPDWVDLDKVAIPQADEQQRLLANLIIRMNADKKPLPRFWYLPRGLAAAVVMSGDDHNGNGTSGRFDAQLDLGPAGCSIENWECIRSTSYVFPENALTNSQASTYASVGFEIGAHISSNCANWTPASLETFFSDQLADWSSKYSGIPAPITNRMHCIAWSDYATMPVVELRHGIRLDTNYYYWPSNWVNDKPGFFTGSGMPMRFADLQGNLIDVYQAATQLTDESGQTYPFTIDTLLDRAIGPEGYYGVFTANAHTDAADTVESESIIRSARARGIPVVAARQMLDWLDSRNASRFTSLGWNNTTLDLTIAVGQGANGLTAMVPLLSNLTVANVTRNSKAIAYSTRTVKGIPYAVFAAESGAYQVSFLRDTTAPTILAASPAEGASGVSVMTRVTITFTKDMDPATINAATVQLRDPQSAPAAATIQYDAATRTATLAPIASLATAAIYRVEVFGGASGVKDTAGNPLAGDQTWTFTTASATPKSYSLWPATALPAQTTVSDGLSLTIGVKFRSDVNGSIIGLRFYKGALNNGTHVGSLWSRSGTLLASATFINETSSGWQQALLSSPVPIAANTTYVASYYSSSGYFALSSNYFGVGFDVPPLHALANGVDSGNGVYLYGNGFPTQTWNSNNYWVDVVFQP